jgi:hypothetical protein
LFVSKEKFEKKFKKTKTKVGKMIRLFVEAKQRHQLHRNNGARNRAKSGKICKQSEPIINSGKNWQLAFVCR